MKSEELVASYLGREMGRVRRSGDQLAFTYEQSWTSGASFPLSVSMPLATARHGHHAIEPFLWNLLPDNEWVLERWAQRFSVSARNPFKLLAHIGEDCAGAISFVPPERAADLAKVRASDVRWLDEEEVAERLRLLREDHSVTRLGSDEGQFSLAGAQPKIALLLRKGRWGVPSGAMPTTHILKPPLADYPGHVLNEHLCLGLARALGLAAASSRVVRFGAEMAIVIERYDRAVTSKLVANARTREEAAMLTALAKAHPILRLHQEDLCQALGLRPSNKYQNEGGPGPRAIADLLVEHSSNARADLASFRDALVLNWILAGTDAHAKNYSLLLGASGRIRLAPLYDLASALPYEHLEARKLKLAMKIGRTYRVHDVQRTDWEKLSAELRIDRRETLDRIAELAAAVGPALDATLASIAEAGLEHPVLDRLDRKLRERAAAIGARFGG